ncbi:MAG: hypothetical protein Q8M37_07650 [Nevskia sp.]|nr:hypothetical protein [Nevskia sp.]
MAAISATPIDETGCPEVINVANLQMLPGFLDTHRQSGLARRPRLKESVRRGVTTVTFGLCSIARYQSDFLRLRLRLRASREAELRLALEALLPRCAAGSSRIRRWRHCCCRKWRGRYWTVRHRRPETVRQRTEVKQS